MTKPNQPDEVETLKVLREIVRAYDALVNAELRRDPKAIEAERSQLAGYVSVAADLLGITPRERRNQH